MVHVMAIDKMIDAHVDEAVEQNVDDDDDCLLNHVEQQPVQNDVAQ
jgi:hypothetical protein